MGIDPENPEGAAGAGFHSNFGGGDIDPS